MKFILALIALLCLFAAPHSYGRGLADPSRRIFTAPLPSVYSLNNPMDTIDNWQIYLNDSLVFKENENIFHAITYSPKESHLIHIHVEDLQTSDSLFIYYSTCMSYARIKRIRFADANGAVLLEINVRDASGDLPLSLDYQQLASLRGKGELSIYYNEYMVDERLLASLDAKQGYRFPDRQLACIKVE